MKRSAELVHFSIAAMTIFLCHGGVVQGLHAEENEEVDRNWVQETLPGKIFVGTEESNQSPVQDITAWEVNGGEAWGMMSSPAMQTALMFMTDYAHCRFAGQDLSPGASSSEILDETIRGSTRIILWEADFDEK